MTKSASISSHLLSVTIKRWVSLILCSVAASLLLFFLSELAWMQAAFKVYSKIITANIWVYHASAFIAGIAIKVLLDRFRVSHPERMIRPNLRYPPLTISIFLTLGILGYFSIYYRDNSAEIIIFMIESKVFSQLYLVILGVCAAHLQHLISIKKFEFSFAILFFIILTSTYIALENKYSLISYLAISCYIVILSVIIFFEHYLTKSKIFSNIRPKANNFSSEDKVSKNFENWTLKDFQQWFKDDKPMESISDLEPDYQVYAKRIYERLIHGGIKTEQELAQHIALYGPFGCGKSSIILSVVNELEKRVIDGKENKKTEWIHCDITTWGIQADHVAEVVLTHVIDTIAEKLDMCAFRSLPKHYVEAMKGGGSHWQIMAALLNKATDVETCLVELNSVLAATNINLLITIQDIDRGTPEDITRRLNELAALLDHLKNRILNKINFIIAIDYEVQDQAGVISKTTNISEYILKINYQSIISKWHTLNLEEIFNQGLLLTEKPLINSIEEDNADQGLNHTAKNRLLNKHIMASNQLIHSIRIMKKIMRHVDSCWTKEKLLGEVDLDTLLLTFTLRETEPDLFNAFINIYPDLFYSPNALQKNARGENTEISVSTRINEIITNTKKILNKSEQFYINLVGIILDIDDLSKANGQTIPVKLEQYKTTQTLRNQLNCTNYLNRFLLETIPSDELSDQYVLKTFKAFEESTEEQKRTITENILSDNRWLEAYQRFSHVMFSNENKLENQKTFFNQLVCFSTEKPDLSERLNQDWFKKLCIELIKGNLFEHAFKKLSKSKKITPLYTMVNTIKNNNELCDLAFKNTDLIKLTNQELINLIDEQPEIILEIMYIYCFNYNYGEKISPEIYFLLMIFASEKKEFQIKAKSLLSGYLRSKPQNINTPYFGDNSDKSETIEEIIKNTLFKIEKDLKNNDHTRWTGLIETLSAQKDDSIEDVYLIDFILEEMIKIDGKKNNLPI